VALSTGRSFRSCRRVLARLSLDSDPIFFDGAVVGHHDLSHEVSVTPLGRAVVEEMVAFARGRGIDLELFSTTEYFAARETWSTAAHRKYFTVEPEFADFDLVVARERIVKVGLVSTTAGEFAQAALFQEHFGGKVHFSPARTPAYPGVVFHNILAPRVSKGRALGQLAEHLGVTVAEIVAVGDGLNDLSLLAAAGEGVAMGNAPEELKEIADFVTGDVEEQGLAAAIERYFG
ncbi:MAG: HAD hydrolase family protein, partial [Chloroflexota bacterium]